MAMMPKTASDPTGADTEKAIDDAAQVAAVGRRLSGERRKHMLVCDFSKPMKEIVVLDGLSIGDMLRGVSIRAQANSLPEIEFDVCPGQIVKLRALLPEARCVVAVSQAALEVALFETLRALGRDGPTDDVPKIASELLKRLGGERR